MYRAMHPPSDDISHSARAIDSAYGAGVKEERERLRPLLEDVERDFTILSRAFGFVEPASLHNLRRELGKE